MNDPKPTPFPIFASEAEAEAYSDKIGDAYFEMCYFLEGRLNRCLVAMSDLYAQAPPARRPKMQTGLVRTFLCPDGWPKDPKVLVDLLQICRRYRHEDTCHAYRINEALIACDLESRHNNTLTDFSIQLEPLNLPQTEMLKARNAWLRLCDWVECRLHDDIHQMWYRCPDSFSDDLEHGFLANIGMTQRHLAKLSQRDREIWTGIHDRAATKHQANLKLWGTVGKVQYDPQPRTWTHPRVDTLVIALWPLVVRYNWTYPDLLKALDELLPLPAGAGDRCYPLDSVESLKVHCRSVCGLTKSTKGKSAVGFPEGWEIARQLFSGMGK